MIFLNIILSRRVGIVSNPLSTLILCVVTISCCFISLLGPFLYCIDDCKGLMRHDIWIVIDVLLAILLITISVVVTDYQNINSTLEYNSLGWLMVVSLSLAWA